ncbi:adenylate cyclase [Malassezia obtusa]|uniref:Adenylate cyclase n=1 Tax=Malassezia obtusa TaxID=76774 RepID=A0AAF0E378_9BASI|nr:adenylate cyclase [Malassezia obtusa]
MDEARERPAPPGDAGIIDQSVAYTKDDGQAMENITPWQSAAPTEHAAPPEPAPSAARHRSRNPLHLFRTAPLAPFRARARPEPDTRSIDSERTTSSRRLRSWLTSRKPSTDEDARAPSPSALSRIGSRESSHMDANGVVAAPTPALGIALDTNFDQMDDIVDLRRARSPFYARSISPTQVDTPPRTASPAVATGSPRTLSPALTNTSPQLRSRWSTDSEAPRTHVSPGTPAPRGSGIDWHVRAPDADRRTSAGSYLTVDSLRSDSIDAREDDVPRPAPALVVPPPVRALRQDPMSSSWAAPDSWAVRPHEALDSLRHVGGECADDEPSERVSGAPARGADARMPTSIVVYDQPPETPTSTPATPLPWPDEQHRRSWLFSGRRSNKLDALLAPDLAISHTHSRNGSGDELLPLGDESCSRLPFLANHHQHQHEHLHRHPPAPAAKQRTYRHGVHAPHLPFRRFARKSEATSPRVDTAPDLEADATPRATVWHFATRQRGDTAATESDAVPVPTQNPEPLTPAAMQHAGHPRVFLRVYLQDDTFLRLSCAPETTVAEVLFVLARTIGLADAQGYGLFLYEKGADRPLIPTERPARILRRRLLQAGYNDTDGLDTLGSEDMSYLLRFVFRPDRVRVLQGVALEAQEQTYKHLNLQSMHLTMIPVFLYKHAHWIVSLDLSKNPITDFPVDFVQRCTHLRMLRLSALALTCVPQSVCAAQTLSHLDCSTNRILDLAHIALDQLPELKALRMLNNRLAQLPPYTPQLHALTTLNLSNNRFDAFPAVLCGVPQLRDLDLSFNTIAHIPPEIAALRQLERLVLMGNKLNRLPDEVLELTELHTLDVRNTNIHWLGRTLSLPKLTRVLASNNYLTTLDSEVSSTLQTLDLAHNPLSKAQLATPTVTRLTQLDLSHANLARLNESLFRSLPALTHLALDHNQFASLPPLDALGALEHLSCAANALTHLPDSIGELRALQRLDVQNNNLRVLPATLWRCPSLYAINASSNLLETFPAPPAATPTAPGAPSEAGERQNPLRFSLVLLRLADNRLTDEVFSVLALLSELEVLNLSMNELYEVPSGALMHLSELRELYLSSNKLSSLPADDLERLERLRVLFVNGNKLMTLPAELGRLKQLRALDVGNNILKYNIANWHYDWNWNANPELRYLNLSGNQRFEIKPKQAGVDGRERDLADFHRLRHLRLLGLMEVTMTHQPLPDETDDRRIRTTLSQVNAMPYGIADTLGNDDSLQVFDVVLSHFRQSDHEALYGLVEGHNASSRAGSHIARYVAEHCGRVLAEELHRAGTPRPSHSMHVPHGESDVPNALRRAFLRMDQAYAMHILSLDVTKDKSQATSTQGASIAAAASAAAAAAGAGAQEMFWGWPASTPSVHRSLWEASATAIVAYQRGHRLYIANVGDALAVLSHGGGSIRVLGTKHDPLDRDETQRIRNAEGWVSLRGYVNDKLHVARAIGHFQLTPIVSACPSVQCIELSDADEFVIVANAELWRYIPYQMAVDIARMDREHPRQASERLRDIAVSYGATKHITVMVIAVGALFHEQLDANVQTRLLQRAQDASKKITRRGRGDNDSTLARLEREVLPPIGQVALVFTDIKNSTLLWETNPGMQSAIRLHNLLLRRQLRSIGGYEAKTEGDAFMVSFPSVSAALLWCFTVQLRLLTVDWPHEILESDDGYPIHDEDGTLLYRGLSVRMGIHWGTPVCEIDPVNSRMDYFGPMVNRAARISNAADGGQILVSRDVVHELEALLRKYEDAEMSPTETAPPPINPVPRDVVFLRRLGLGIISVGERRLKGIEIPEHLSLVYPKQLSGRYHFLPGARSSTARLQMYEPTLHLLDIEQVKQIGFLCLRLEALSSGVWLPGLQLHEGSHTLTTAQLRQPPPRAERNRVVERLVARHPELLIIATREEATDSELIHILAQLVTRIYNSITTLSVRHVYSSLHGELGELARLLAP